jgi:hypothetical protein
MSTEYERPGLVHVLTRERDEARNALHLAESAAEMAFDERDRLIRENGGLREVIREAHAALSRVATEAKAREGLQCGCPSIVTMYLKAEVVDESRAALAKLNPFTTP